MLAGGEETGPVDGGRRWWMAAAGAALGCAALWLRAPSVPYLIACALATAVTGVLTLRLQGRCRWAAAFVVAAAAVCATAAVSQRAIWRAEHRWPAEAASAAAAAEQALAREIAAEAGRLRDVAARALDAPADVADAFRSLGALAAGGMGERGVVVYRDGAATAWGGQVRVLPDTLRSPVGAEVTPFYVTLYAAARRGAAEALATTVVHAEPPADRLARPMDRAVARRGSAKAFDYAPVADAVPGGYTAVAPAGAPLFAVRATAPAQGELLLRTVEVARTRGAVALALATFCFLVATWRRRAPLARRLAAFGVALALTALVPLNAFSNVSVLFDATYYFAALGGPFTASVGALGLAGALLLLAVLAVLRSPIRYPSRALAVAVVLVVASVGPYLLRGIARGITPPAWGVPMPLWLAWQVTIFLVAISVLLAGASAGRAALGARRGLPPQVAPALAAVAALLAPSLWAAPGRWPAWYPALWITAALALALTRRARGFVLTAAIVAGSGAATLVWGATARKRVELATRDVAGLTTVDPSARALLERFAAELAADEPPTTRVELLRRYVASDLAAAEYPVGLAAWLPQGAVAGLDVAVSALNSQVAGVAALARAGGATQIVELPGSPGVQLLAAVPHADGVVTTVVVGPRTRLIPDDPFSALMGVAPDAAVEPPYSLSLLEVGGQSSQLDGEPRWTRRGSELHGDWVIGAPARPARVHVEVELRSIEALVQRGVLVVLLDLAVVAVLWTLAALADGGVGRWVRVRRRAWMRSYRARLTVALAGFFVVPAVVFAAWSYRRLQADDQAANTTAGTTKKPASATVSRAR